MLCQSWSRQGSPSSKILTIGHPFTQCRPINDSTYPCHPQRLWPRVKHIKHGPLWDVLSALHKLYTVHMLHTMMCARGGFLPFM